MPFRPHLVFLLLLSLALGLPEARAQTEAEGADPEVVLGELPNGFRYALRRQPVPPGRVSLHLFVDAGSADETDSELGYAHFVEHMAFAGTRDFPGDGVIRTLQHFGLAFGSEINAATGRTYTVYKLARVPVDVPGALETALRVMRNYAGELEFDPLAVERERGVILSETRVRAGRISYWWGGDFEFVEPFDEGLTLGELEGTFPGSPWARSQLGPRRSIQRATPEGLRAFYQRWYRPQRMVLAVAGDLDPARLALLVGPLFADLAARGPEPIRAAPVAATGRESLDTALVVDADAPGVQVSLVGFRPAPAVPASPRERVAEQLVLHLLENRLCTGLSVGAVVDSVHGHELTGADLAVLRVRTSAESWIGAAVGLETELRRAWAHGFGPEELAEAGLWGLRQARWQERDAANRPADQVAAALAQAVGRGLPFPAPEAERRRLEAVLPTLTSDDCVEAVRRLWPPAATRLVATGPVDKGIGAGWALRRALEKARRTVPEPYRPQAPVDVVLPGDSGITGSVTSREHNAALDCWLVQFDNGVRLNFKESRFEQGRVRVRIGFGHGLLGTEPGREGLAFGIAALYHGRIPGLDADQERELRERGEIATSFGFGADRLGLSGTCARGGFNTAMRLFAARFASPEFPAGGEAPTRAFVDSQLARHERTAPGVAEDRIREYMYDGHPALTRPRRDDVSNLDFAQMRAWIEPQLRDSPVEITVVGDIDLGEVIEVVSRTFGAMPLRSTVDPLAERRLYSPGATPFRQEVRFRGKRSVGSVVLAWRLPDVVGQADDCRMRLLAAVLEDRIRVRLRREMGRTYSPSVGLLAERALAPAMLILRCRVETAPRDLERVAVATNAVVADLVRGGVGAEELERARGPLVRQSTDNLSSNQWWMSVLDEAQTKPQYLAQQGEQASLYGEIGARELDELGRLLFATDRRCELLVRPE